MRKFKFHTCLLNFLRVGHTHEDVDQVFAVLLQLVLRRFRFQSPEELCDFIRVGMRDFVFQRGEDLFVGILDHVRDFGAWLDAAHVGPEGCFVSRGGVDVPHSFLFKFRMDLSFSESEKLRCTEAANARRFVHDALDVFVIQKHFMASVETEPPVLILPNERFGRLSPAPGGLCKGEAMTAKRQGELEKLANYLEGFTSRWADGNSYFRGAEALRDLARGREHEASNDMFLERSDPPRTRPVATTGNVYFANLPDAVWRMKVVFGR